MAPVTTANPSPTAPTVGAVVPFPVVDLLHFCLSIFVNGLCLWRIEFVENTVSRAWNTGHRIDWADSACKRSGPGNAKHRSQE
ncbi:hypothetical protein NKI77_23195 [Mesorhizobium opportunistum]|uniref:Uncharacterized protein n=1 Tax=Mesorhizobium opportunistum TaxID=593909 RepID=A0ABV1YK20_9HYPH|nr:hypothetical protein [Mesorhizobium sp.]